MSVSAFPHGAAAAAAAAGDTLTLSALSSSDSEFSGTARSGIRVTNGGYVQEIISGVFTNQNPSTEWIDNKSATMSDYECRLTKTLGTDPTSGSLNTWLNLGTTRTWYLDRSFFGSVTFNGTLEIREVANTSNSVSAGVTLFSEIIV